MASTFTIVNNFRNLTANPGSPIDKMADSVDNLAKTILQLGSSNHSWRLLRGILFKYRNVPLKIRAVDHNSNF
jgi:hypothetical protein